MLRKETVSQSTLELLTTLMKDPLLEDFFLVGGTALALQIGHRLSIDIDLFSKKPFDADQLLAEIEFRYPFQLNYQARHTLKGSIDGVQVDLITHNYPLVNDLLVVEDVRMASAEDIAAMKLNSISGNGTRLKDFIDVAYLSSSLSLSQMIDAFCEKYGNRNPAMLVKALDYHKDIDFLEPIQMLGSKYNWKSIETRLGQMTMQPQRLFPEMEIGDKSQVKSIQTKKQRDNGKEQGDGLGI
ncbi:nucleotidyl transferase AbiEii/AbiGii toxin family protein [Pedobacter psychroterrae]|uniref:Nucleotidyltransferase n=1 Tax=Pedobacter psychroterrae TaxID=2530453 RepID=A0A4V2MLB1_9SPHI|nr:nucleotidyl transferase AbiEii/AbiGii toxin family protein [Pedobacter psychroterrae]TCD01297.1 nucleotidyltransferase [Pedobacter psychroterrae]